MTGLPDRYDAVAEQVDQAGRGLAVAMKQLNAGDPPLDSITVLATVSVYISDAIMILAELAERQAPVPAEVPKTSELLWTPPR